MENRSYIISPCLLAMCLALCCTLQTSCQNRPQTKASEATPDAPVAAAVTGFPYPEIPTTLTDVPARLEYLLTHYWERLDLNDTLLLNNPEVTEQGFVNFIDLMRDEHLTAEMRREAWESLAALLAEATEGRKRLDDLCDDYLYNPNSPLYNESLYALYLEAMSGQAGVDEAVKERMRFRLELVRRNRPGEKAEDFAYYTPDGTRQTLHHTPVQGKHLLLLFYDPECSHCQEVMEVLQDSPRLNQLLRCGEATLLAIYTEGNEQAWRESLPLLPRRWLKGNDREAVKQQALYDLKAMPSLYLLNADKQVVLKDTSPEECLTRMEIKGDKGR